MKKLFLWVMVVLGWGGMISCLSPQKTSDWKLVWEDDFGYTDLVEDTSLDSGMGAPHVG